MLNELPNYTPGPLVAGILEPDDLNLLGVIPGDRTRPAASQIWALVSVNSIRELTHLEFLYLATRRADSELEWSANAYLRLLGSEEPPTDG